MVLDEVGCLFVPHLAHPLDFLFERQLLRIFAKGEHLLDQLVPVGILKILPKMLPGTFQVHNWSPLKRIIEIIQRSCKQEPTRQRFPPIPIEVLVDHCETVIIPTHTNDSHKPQPVCQTHNPGRKMLRPYAPPQCGQPIPNND